MSEKKVNYGEYVVLGMNKAMLAFLISFVLCLGISLLINLRFYEELITLTVGGLGEAGSAESGTILKTAVLVLGLSTFQVTGKFQMGLLILGIIPILSFLISGLIFRVRTSENKTSVDMGVSMLIDGVAALIFSVFILLSSMVARGEVFGLNIDFVSVRNFGFTVLFTIFIQFFLGWNKHDTVTVLTSGLVRSRKLLRLVLGFSALTGILFILYYLTPYVKGVVKILLVLAVILPNLAVYLSFLLMGITVDPGDSLKSLTTYLPNFNWNAFAIPTSIRVVLIVAFLLIVLILLVRIPARQYWQNLLVFIVGFSLSSWLLAVASRISSGFRGALNIDISVSLWKAFLVPVILILLDGILLALLRMLCREVKGENATGVFAALICGLEAENAEASADRERTKALQAAVDEEEEEEDDSEIDIWKELAARPIPGSEPVEKKTEEKPKQRQESFFAKAALNPKAETGHNSVKEEKPTSREPEEIKDLPEKKAETWAEEEIQVLPVKRVGRPWKTNEAEKTVQPAEKEPEKDIKEIDISLFPRKKKPVFGGFMDFSDMEDDIFVDEYEAEETLEDFVDAEDLPVEMPVEEEPEAEEAEHTRVIGRAEPAEDMWEETIPYKIVHRR